MSQSTCEKDIHVPVEFNGASDEFIAYFRRMMMSQSLKYVNGCTVPLDNFRERFAPSGESTLFDRGMIIFASSYYANQKNSNRICWIFNSTLHFACTNDKCKYESRCAMCGESGHGALMDTDMYSKDNQYICPIQNMIYTNLKKLNISYNRFYQLIAISHS